MLHNSKIPLIDECCLGYFIMIREFFFLLLDLCFDLGVTFFLNMENINGLLI